MIPMIYHVLYNYCNVYSSTTVIRYSSCYEYESLEPLTACGRVLYLREGQEILLAGLSRSIGSAADLRFILDLSCITIDPAEK